MGRGQWSLFLGCQAGRQGGMPIILDSYKCGRWPCDLLGRPLDQKSRHEEIGFILWAQADGFCPSASVGRIGS